MHTTTNLYLVSLAVTDLIYTTTGITEKIYKYLGSPIYGDFVYSLDISCMLVPLIKNTGLFASQFLVAVFSYERYCAVCHPLTSHRIGSKRRAYKHITITCVISLVLAASIVTSSAKRIVYCMVWPADEETLFLPDTRIICAPIKEGYMCYAEFAQTIPFFTVMIFSNTAYVLIIREIRSSARNTKLKRADSKRPIKESIQITKMLIINGALFFFLMAPFHTLSLCTMIGRMRGGIYALSDDTYRCLLQAFRILAYYNAVVDPVIYSAVNPSYRNAMHHVLCAPLKLKRKRQNSSYSMSYLLSERDRRPSNTLTTSI
ncbi:thyrotropin-releasing hormone receptor-like [Anneissia japonica]|uniref:thyrotropin-releasing hormone receptor-like n=1 Tax=Anneissia japonica TaxID=1529436 RepID=UPI001425AEFF|nr:thyrotropin-releasing hormone receptor-like [Anneissia japonica]